MGPVVAVCPQPSRGRMCPEAGHRFRPIREQWFTSGEPGKMRCPVRGGLLFSRVGQGQPCCCRQHPHGEPHPTETLEVREAGCTQEAVSSSLRSAFTPCRLSGSAPRRDSVLVVFFLFLRLRLGPCVLFRGLSGEPGPRPQTQSPHPNPSSTGSCIRAAEHLLH